MRDKGKGEEEGMFKPQIFRSNTHQGRLYIETKATAPRFIVVETPLASTDFVASGGHTKFD